MWSIYFIFFYKENIAHGTFKYYILLIYKYSIIKMQVVPAILMFIFQVSYMCIVAK